MVKYFFKNHNILIFCKQKRYVCRKIDYSEGLDTINQYKVIICPVFASIRSIAYKLADMWKKR